MPDGSRHPYPYEGEVRLLRWGESSTAGRTITLELPPDAGEHPFKGFPVGTKGGQRFRMSFAVILDDETTPAESDVPEAPARPTKPDLDRSRRSREAYRNQTEEERAVTDAAIFCQDKAHQAEMQRRHHALWASEAAPGMKPEEVMSACLCDLLGIFRKRDLVSNPPARADFYELRDEFDRAAGRIPEPR